MATVRYANALARYIASEEPNQIHSLLQKVSDTEALMDVLLTGVASPNWRVRLRCVQGLAKGSTRDDVLRALRERLADPEELVCTAAAVTLGALGDRAARGAITALAGRLIGAKRYFQARDPLAALVALGPPNAEGLERMREVARIHFGPGMHMDGTLRVAFQGLGVLGERGGEEEALLRRGLHDENFHVVHGSVRGAAALIDDAVELAELVRHAGRIYDTIPALQHEREGFRAILAAADGAAESPAEAEARVEGDAAARSAERTFGGWWIVRLGEPEPTEWRLHEVEADFDPTRPPGDAAAFSEAVAEEDHPVEGWLRIDEGAGAGQLAIDHDTTFWRFRDGTCEELVPFAGEWVEVDGPDSLAEWKALALRELHAFAARWALGDYARLRDDAESAEDWASLARLYQEVLDFAEPSHAPLAEEARTQLAVCALAGPGEPTDEVLATLDRALDGLESFEHRDHDREARRRVAELAHAAEDSSLQGAVRDAIAERLRAVLALAELPSGAAVPDRWAVFAEWLPALPDATRARTLELLADTAHPGLLAVVGPQLSQIGRVEAAVAILERARDGYLEHDQPVPEGLLANLEAGYLTLGRDAEAEALAQSRSGTGAEATGDGFAIDAAMARVTDITNQTYRHFSAGGSLDELVDLCREGAELQLRVLEFWKPHPLSGGTFPAGRATSQASANYLDCLLRRDEVITAADFFRRASADESILRAQIRDFRGNAESFIACGLVALRRASRPEDLAHARRCLPIALHDGAITRPWSHFAVAAIFAALGEREQAIDHLTKALETPGAPVDALRADAAQDPALAPLLE